MESDFTKHILKMLLIGKEYLLKSPLLTKETGHLDAKGNKTIEMDVVLETALIRYIKEQNLPVQIYSEEIGVVDFHPNPTHIISFDPLDGSSNYKFGKGLLPFGVLIAVFKGLKPKLKDVVSAGIYEYSRDQIWVYENGQTLDTKGGLVSLKNDWQAQRSTPVYLDLFYKSAYDAYINIPEKLFIKNTGSTAGNLFHLLSNLGAAMSHINMKAEEIGAVYALIKGAGGIALDHHGRDLSEEPFVVGHTYPLIGGAENIVEFMLKQIDL